MARCDIITPVERSAFDGARGTPVPNAVALAACAADHYVAYAAYIASTPPRRAVLV